MATFKPEISYKKNDGTYNVKLRVTHNREVRRISTHLYITDDDIKNGKIKNQNIIDKCENLIRDCRNICNDLGYVVVDMPIEELVDRLKQGLRGRDKFRLNFFEYGRRKMLEASDGSALTLSTALQSLSRFVGSENLDINEITVDFLKKYQKFLENEPQMNSFEKKTKKTVSTQMLYISRLRMLYNLAKSEYNDEDRGVINIPYSPFKYIKFNQKPTTRKRALSVEQIQQIIDYEPATVVSEFARDCFIMSFALIGMNAIDMYNAKKPKDDILIYNRTKTATRRSDNAEIHVKIPECIDYLLEKYSDPTGEYLFNFHKITTGAKVLNVRLNNGLKIIGNDLGIDKLQFYAARHSWATIARSSLVGIDKYTVHEALNHVDSSMSVTDIYIERDWSNIWKANDKVLSLFDWSNIGYNIF